MFGVKGKCVNGSERNPLSENRLETTFEEKKPPMTAVEAVVEANRCLFCHDAPCVAACATSVDVPRFIRKITTGNFAGSAHTIFDANLLGYSCGCVCPVEVMCAGACVLHDRGESPIQIGRLQRFATGWAMEAKGASLFPKAEPVGKKVAAVGGGPASLACAAYLALHGVEVKVFEKRAVPGGLNTTGVAPYKMQAHESLAESQWLESLGFEVSCGIEVGRDLTFKELIKDFDAVFFGVGLGSDSSLGLSGEEGEGVWGATTLIEAIKNREDFRLPDGMHSIVVLGAGNTAVDIACELAQLTTAKVTMVYRRSEAEMRGYAHEIKHARTHGVTLVEHAQPTAVVRNSSGALVGVRTADPREQGLERVFTCDLLVMAVGQEKHAALQGLDLGIDEKGKVIVDAETRETTLPHVYAGGDCVNGGREVVNAAEDGREAALAMLRSWGLEPTFGRTK